MTEIDWTKDTKVYATYLKNFVIFRMRDHFNEAPTLNETFNYIINDVLLKYNYLEKWELKAGLRDTLKAKCTELYNQAVVDYYGGKNCDIPYAQQVAKRDNMMKENLSNYLGFRMYKLGFSKDEIDNKLKDLGLNTYTKYRNFPLDDAFRKDCHDIVYSPAETDLANLIRIIIPEELYREIKPTAIPVRKLPTK